MKSKKPALKKDFNQDVKTFEKLPEKVKALNLLKDQLEKAAGQESVGLTRQIHEESPEDSA